MSRINIIYFSVDPKTQYSRSVCCINYVCVTPQEWSRHSRKVMSDVICVILSGCNLPHTYAHVRTWVA